uniref:Uncharacterized protein n=1 Tax=Anguilla anguilla TaxID=7936 RepID=A0A0E9Q7K8_ANGAN
MNSISATSGEGKKRQKVLFSFFFFLKYWLYPFLK